MNWADKSVRRAKGIAPEHPIPEEPGELRNRAIELNNRAESARAGYFMGAQWQREQLRTPEAIERMAVAIYEMEDPLANAGWAFESEDLKDTYREWAKDQITALLGED